MPDARESANRQWSVSTTPALSVDLAQYRPSETLWLTIVNHGAPITGMNAGARRLIVRAVAVGSSAIPAIYGPGTAKNTSGIGRP